MARRKVKAKVKAEAKVKDVIIHNPDLTKKDVDRAYPMKIRFNGKDVKKAVSIKGKSVAFTKGDTWQLSLGNTKTDIKAKVLNINDIDFIKSKEVNAFCRFLVKNGNLDKYPLTLGAGYSGGQFSLNNPSQKNTSSYKNHVGYQDRVFFITRSSYLDILAFCEKTKATIKTASKPSWRSFDATESNVNALTKELKAYIQ